MLYEKMNLPVILELCKPCLDIVNCHLKEAVRQLLIVLVSIVSCVQMIDKWLPVHRLQMETQAIGGEERTG